MNISMPVDLLISIKIKPSYKLKSLLGWQMGICWVSLGYYVIQPNPTQKRWVEPI